MTLRGVGIDVADVHRIARLLESSGDRFTRRWFTDEEIAECDAGVDRAAAYTARFAAKEAVWKSLRLSGDMAVPWRSISVLTDGPGSPASVSLGGQIATAAAGAGVSKIQVSWSSGSGVVTAVALAELSHL